MKPHVRAALAATALSHATGRKVSSVYDYSGSSYINIDASVSGQRVTGYDYSNSCHFDGNIPSLYHYGSSSHIDFKPSDGGRYEGYDYDTNSHFQITIKGREAEIYDYGASAFFSYSL